ncbi:MAG TPA: hypothetical protein VL357_09415 [Rariglobus sp.]|jgi:hypothetical protein|nr:hypothetical protein [Rariglobus sp.]
MISRPSKEHLFAELEVFLARAETCRNSFSLLVHFAIRLAGSADARRVLAIVKRSPEASLFSPLITGLRIHLGEITPASGEADPLACQIAERIAEAAVSRIPAQAVA